MSLRGKGMLSQQMRKELFQKTPRPAERSGKVYLEMLEMFLLS